MHNAMIHTGIFRSRKSCAYVEVECFDEYF